MTFDACSSIPGVTYRQRSLHRVRMGKKTVVYTPGVWDLLHAGHLNILHRAKLSGDYLIVGVCADRLVEETKGTPIISESDRASLLSGLKCVDEVHVYDSLDQSATLELFKVDVLCVGEEFGNCKEHVQTLSFCEENDISVRVIRRYPGVSSTALRERVLKRVSLKSIPSLAVDYHDCLSFAPEFFRTLFNTWPGKTYILSGTPQKQRSKVIAELSELGFHEGETYEGLLLGFDYVEKDMSVEHFKRMREHKLSMIQKYDIDIFFDDNPFYVDWMRNHGVTTFQIVLPNKYLTEFGQKDPFFTCHLQDRQFHFLSLLGDADVKKL